jgi:acetyltransferase-like isoleucine patch superfamily enzyme
MRDDVSFGFYVAHFVFRYILRQNTGVGWAVHHTSTLYFSERIKRGKHVYPGDSPGNFIDAKNGIEIGDFTNIGPSVGLISSNHQLIDNSKYSVDDPIRIGAFCWIGMNVIILPAVQLGDFTIVGAGAVVTDSFREGFCVIAGNPAKIVKYLDKDECEQFRKTKYLS